MAISPSTDRSFLSGHSKGGVWDHATAPTGEDAWETIDLGSGIFMLGVGGGNPGGNLAMLTGDDGAVLIDNGLQKAANVTVATTESLAGGPVKYLISTHLHGDHVGCNTNYAEAGAIIIAHDNTRSALLADEDFDNRGLPTITFNDKATFHLNEQTTELLYFPAAHTNSDIIVHFKEANVIHAADLFFNKVFPFIDLTNGGNIDGYIAAKKRIIDLANDETVIIPGHGPIGNKADMQEALDLIADVKYCMTPLIERGLSMEDVLWENPLARFEKWAWFHISIERMTQVVYCLLTESKGNA